MIFPENSTPSPARADAAPWRRLAALFAVAMLGLCLAGCGYNTIPTLEEQVKALGRGPEPVPAPGRPGAQSRRFGARLRAAGKGRADRRDQRPRQGDLGNTDASQLTDPGSCTKFQPAQGELSSALSAPRGDRELSAAQIGPAVSRPDAQLEGTENRITVARRDTSRPFRPLTPRCRPSRPCSGPRRCSRASSRSPPSPPTTRRRPPRKSSSRGELDVQSKPQ